jgi:hypothetical protein
MAFLDWMKQRGNESASAPAKEAERTPAETRALFAEWKRDHQLARQRDETGREPERAPVPKAKPKPEPIRLKQPGDPFKRGDRVIVYETFHHARELKHPRYVLGVVASVYHNGTLVNYGRLGRLPANAAIEDVQHATREELEKYGNRFDAIAGRMQRQNRGAGYER